MLEEEIVQCKGHDWGRADRKYWIDVLSINIYSIFVVTVNMRTVVTDSLCEGTTMF